jgi:hypothetical protein
VRGLLASGVYELGQRRQAAQESRVGSQTVQPNRSMVPFWPGAGHERMFLWPGTGSDPR